MKSNFYILINFIFLSKVFATFSIIAVAITLWLIYGILVGSLSLIISNGLVLVLILIVLIGAWKVQKEN